MLFTELNPNVLLHVYEQLDLIDAINLGSTCVQLRDVAQLHYQQRYKIFNLDNFIKSREAKRHNRLGASIVLRQIGAFISALVADFDETVIGADVAASIRKYCRNVKSLKIVDGHRKDNPYTAYAEWFKSVKLEKLTIPAKDTHLMDLSTTTTLTEFHIYIGQYFRQMSEQLKSIIERNCNIRSLSIAAALWGFYPEILANIKSLKYLGLHIGILENILEITANKLVAKDLEKVDIKFVAINSASFNSFDYLNILLKKLAANAPMLSDLSIEIVNHDHGDDDDEADLILDKCPLPLSLFNLTSLRLDIMCPSLYKDLPKMQPNLKHLDLVVYASSASIDPMELTRQIISLIANLGKLEVFHMKINDDDEEPDVSQESVIRQIFDACSKNRPTLQLYVQHENVWLGILGVKVNE